MSGPYRVVHDWSVPADRDAPLLIDGDGAPVAWGTFDSVCAALNAAHASGVRAERKRIVEWLRKNPTSKLSYDLATELERAEG